MCWVTWRAIYCRPYEEEVETSSARRLLCSVVNLGDPLSGGGGGGGGGEGGDITGVGGDVGGRGEDEGDDGKGKGKRRTIKKGRFLGSSRAFAPPPEALNASDSRVFLLTGRALPDSRLASQGLTSQGLTSQPPYLTGPHLTAASSSQCLT